MSKFCFTENLAITTLKACSGLLWIGTNCGRLLTLPLPRLQGVPKVTITINTNYFIFYYCC